MVKAPATKKATKDVSTLGQKLSVLLLGVPMIILVSSVLYYGVHNILQLDGYSQCLMDRIVFGLKCSALSSLPLAIGIQVVAQQRFYSTQFNPLAGATPSYRFQVNCRFISNTAEQLLLLVAGTMGASATLAIDLRFVFAMNLLFIFARLLFWIGYHIEPRWRSAGMALTFFSTLSLLGSSTFFFIRDDFPIIFLQ